MNSEFKPLYNLVSFFPRNFFNKEINEPFIRDVMADVLNIANWKQGNPNAFEPDYFGDGVPFEFTIASDSKKKNNFIQRISRGKYASENIENDVTGYIRERIKDKATKKYSVDGVHLCVLCLLDMFLWVSDEYGSVTHCLTDYNRIQFFQEMRSEYIKNGVFNNIFIIFPDMCGKWWVFDVLTDRKSAVVLTTNDIKSNKYPFVIEEKIYKEYISNN
jgi:hypothetical protein